MTESSKCPKLGQKQKVLHFWTLGELCPLSKSMNHGILYIRNYHEKEVTVLKNDARRVLIESMIRRTLDDMKENPGRGTRNLIELGINFAKGRFQKRFFRNAQEMLENENSAYYPMVQDIVNHVDNDCLLTFGMDIGYNSCTKGAKMIRQTEAEQRFDIPWTLTLETEGWSAGTLESVIMQGEKLGIYTWLLFPGETVLNILPVIAAHENSAFILFMPPQTVTRQFISEAGELSNMMTAVGYGEDTESVCKQLRQERLLYSVYFAYRAEDIALIASGELFDAADEYHPAFTVVFPRPECPEMLYSRVYKTVSQIRHDQNYRTIPWDLLGDNCAVDGIISEHACTAGFDRNGCLIRPFEKKEAPEYNLFRNTLSDILKRAFPRKAAAH